MAKKREPKKINLGLIFMIILIAIVVISFVSCTVLMFVEVEPAGDVAQISIDGTLMAGDSGSFLVTGTSSTEIVKLIEKADENEGIKAILFEINSPGGSAVASKEIADAIKRVEKPTYSLIRELGASGAYWAASATDTIVANDLSIVGSIGVIASYIEFAGLLERYNMTYQRLVGGEYKDLGTPFKKLDDDERILLQDKIDKMHDYFIREVASNRGMDVARVREMATGEFYLGFEALELGLVDKLGDKETAIEIIKQDLNMTELDIAEYETTATLMDLFSGVFSSQFFFVGQGIGSAFVDAGIYNKINIIT